MTEAATQVIEKKGAGGYEPKVIAFCCHYCTYSAADLAGSMRLEYSPNIRVVKLMCTGKVDPIILMKAAERRAIAISWKEI